MTTISSVSSAWSGAGVQRAMRPPPSPQQLLEKTDADGSGGVDATELQSLLDGVSTRTGTATDASASDLLTQYDSDGDGSLNADELAQTFESVLPPRSTVDFAQARAAPTEESGDELFSQLDTDGDGTLSQAEFEAGHPSDPGGAQAGMPPPPPGGPGGAGASFSAAYDPLDANEDGVVTSAERAAGTSGTDAVTALLQAIDTDGDSTISSSESQSFIDQLASQYEAAQDTASGSGDTRLDLVKLAEQALRQYAEAAGGWAAHGAASALSAVA